MGTYKAIFRFLHNIRGEYEIMGSNPSNRPRVHEALYMRILRWVIFGVVVSILPILLVRYRSWIAEVATLELDHLSDLLLVIFAISASAINLLWDGKKKISAEIKVSGIAVLVIVMLFCTATYVSLFDQTIYNNKLLDVYERLTTAIESLPVVTTDNPEYEKNIQQLIVIKSIINETTPKPDRLEKIKYTSIASLIGISIFGIAVECFDERERRKPNSKSKSVSKTIPLNGDVSANLPERDGE